MKKVSHETAYLFIYAVARLMGLLPLQVLYAVATVIYVQMYYLFPYRKRVVIQNIARSFPEKRYEEVALISRMFYRSLGDYLAEIVKNISISPEEIKKRIEFENFDIVQSYLEQGKSVIAYMGHCGNWEMMNALPLALPVDMFAVYKPLRQPSIDKFMRRIRSRFGMQMIPARSVVRHLLSRKEQPALYLFLADQCPGQPDRKYHFTFLHQPTFLFCGAEKLAYATHSAVVYIHILRLGRGQYRMTCQPVSDNSRLLEETELTRRYASLLEQNIQEQPHGWLWSHKRWKR